MSSSRVITRILIRGGGRQKGISVRVLLLTIFDFEDEREPKKYITGTLGQESLGKVYRSNALVVRVKKIGVILNIN